MDRPGGRFRQGWGLLTAPGVVRKTLEVGEGEGGARLDVWVAEKLELSRTRVAALLREEKILLDGLPAKKSEPVMPGMQIEVEIPAPVPTHAEPEELPLHIVWEDDDLVVVNKAAGMVVHPSPGHPGGTLVNALLHHVKDLSGIGGALRPGIVHRLDRDTSGLLVIAKGDRVHQALSAALKAREVRRVYRTAVWGHIKESPLTVEAPIGRDPKDRLKMAVIESGRPALTRVRLQERWVAAELLDVALGTGRTHQIRVHMRHIGHPVVGDAVYGPMGAKGISGQAGVWARQFARRVPRQFLHAAELGFNHPATGEALRFRVPLPSDLAVAAAWAESTSRPEPLQGGADEE